MNTSSPLHAMASHTGTIIDTGSGQLRHTRHVECPIGHSGRNENSFPLRAVEIATRAGFSLKNNDEVAKTYVSTWLGKDFEVSSQVIQKRLDKDGLWPSAS